ncbi:uncharacterized protein LOC127723544 [Mytilus californianus]|uniref:uncharacterized protein LOC127723544 n=1 Tax=Mytilus californianus TaxID=6549 RepID=UPI002247C205|nr:uncharacterized protein LOC127723544 [Mytilus californianus]
MNRNSRNDEKDIDHNVYVLRNVNFLEKYGAKRFPYRGRRRYTPFVYRSVDGGIIISNDVFGLTIRQFDRIYKACLDRRKTREQNIINVRYPDKTSDEYLEYLQYSTDYNQDYVTWSGSNLQERNLYEHLVNTAGTEIDMRKRQQLFLTHDMIQNEIMLKLGSKLTEITAGSLAEGLDIPGSDIDIMYVIKDVDVIRDVKNIIHQVQRTTLVMETDNEYPGFTRLRLLAGGEGESYFTPPECFEVTRKGLYLSVNTFVSNIKIRHHDHYIVSSHGPCLTHHYQNVDYAYCLRSKYLPYNTIPWASRYRRQWPPNSVIDKIKKYGCLLVPIGPRTLRDCNVLWRLSFSVAEKLLVHSFNYIQLLCYCLLKLTLKHIVNTNTCAKGLLCSYYLKTVLFWVSEEIDIDTFQLFKLHSCFSHCLRKLILWVNNCYCPNYFIPAQNMFLGKIRTDNNEILKNVLDSIERDGIDGLIQNVRQYDNVNPPLLSSQPRPSFVMLDLLFYRISHLVLARLSDISQCLKLLNTTEYLIQSKSSAFIVDVCKYHHTEISQYAAQLLPTQTVTTERYNMHKHCHKHLQDGIKANAVSGWLLYASFYYVTGQFNVTLRLTDYVLSRCSPDMILLGGQHCHDRHVNYYRNHVHSTMTLRNKMRMAVVNNVRYVQHSSLIPHELQLEVCDHYIVVPPIVMSHFLRFLCYHHTGDFFNRQQALCDLCSTVKGRHLIDVNTLSMSMTILGVCCEISNDTDAAYQCYREALQCDCYICATAETRLSKL